MLKIFDLSKFKIVIYHRLVILFLAIFLSSLAQAQTKSPFQKGVKRILFLGNSITYSGEYITDIEAYFITHYPNQRYEFINAGLPSETVSGLSEPGHAGGAFPRPDLHERLGRVLSQIKPDLVFACYGMNDGVYLPLDAARFGAFQTGIKWLHTELEKSGVKRIIHLTPPVHDDTALGTKGYNLVLDKYSEWLLSQRDSLKWEVADIHTPMTRYLETKRQTQANFKLANDGVHPSELGHWLMARATLEYLGEKVGESPDVLSTMTSQPRAKEIFGLVAQRQAIMKDAWLAATGHKRPGMSPGLPLAEAQQRYVQLEKRLESTLKGTVGIRVRVACIGNSITQGAGLASPQIESYPAQLQNLLGLDYEVLNFGVSSKTVMQTDNSYRATPQYQEALASNPDIVIIKLGTNDSRSPYKLKIERDFVTDYKKLVQTFRELPSKPRIILALPAASYLIDTARQTDAVISGKITSGIRQVAFDEKLELVDLHSITLEKPALFPDQLHPNAAGASLLAKRLAAYLKSKTVPDFDIFKKLKQPYTVESYYGYDCAKFKLAGREAFIVKPRVVAKGQPWVWRARFFGHEAQTDIALLDRGFHVVYIDAVELFGNQEAVNIWNSFYTLLRKGGLAKKAVLEAMSRGGVYAYNWAAQNPKKVAAVYADAPVLDMRSWPGGQGKGSGSANDWKNFKAAYGYATEEETKSFKNNPLDKVAKIVKGKYPMLHVVGDADDVVPVAENTTLFEQQVKALGGDITVIHKPGVGHHPHSLANPQPIVDFILKAVYGKTDL
ncbi:MAG TPA: GDSL-type esterase/lipase family protein [Pedobacter sp.]|jgi:lysophospholipase L1-like esterase/pimeloyl-ACP methyl ester carboxylesterase